MAKDKDFERDYYQIKLSRTKIRKAKRILKKGAPHKCECCRKQSGYDCIHPYYLDMNNEERHTTLCSDCYDSACGDI